MQLASPGPHRAFIATTWTLAVVLTMSLALGWRHHFRQVEHRRLVSQIAAKAEKARLATAYIPGNTLDEAAPSPLKPGESPLRLGNAVLTGFKPNAQTVPVQTIVEALPLVNAGSILSEAEPIVKRYTETQHWQERLQFVFEPERVRKLMEDYYDVQQDVDPVLGPLIDQNRYRLNKTEVVILTYRSGRPTGRLEVVLRRSSSGRLVMDWESFVGYSEMSFAQLTRDRPTSPVLMRGFIKLDDYYNDEFSDSNQNLSLKVTSPDGNHYLNVFCPRDSAMARWLLADLGGDPSHTLEKGYMLWISYPEKAASGRCARLMQIPAGRWLMLPE